MRANSAFFTHKGLFLCNINFCIEPVNGSEIYYILFFPQNLHFLKNYKKYVTYFHRYLWGRKYRDKERCGGKPPQKI